jgi:hypothetical protein
MVFWKLFFSFLSPPPPPKKKVKKQISNFFQEKVGTSIDDEEISKLQISLDAFEDLIMKISDSKEKFNLELTAIQREHLDAIEKVFAAFEEIEMMVSDSRGRLHISFREHREGSNFMEERDQILRLYEQEEERIEGMLQRMTLLEEENPWCEIDVDKFTNQISEICGKHEATLRERKQGVEAKKGVLMEKQRQAILEARESHNKAVQAVQREMEGAKKKLASLQAAKEAEKQRKKKEVEEDSKKKEEECVSSDQSGSADKECEEDCDERERETEEGGAEECQSRQRSRRNESDECLPMSATQDCVNFFGMARERTPPGSPGGMIYRSAGSSMECMEMGAVPRRGSRCRGGGRGRGMSRHPPMEHLRKFKEFVEGFQKTLSDVEQKLARLEEDFGKLSGIEVLEEKCAGVVTRASEELQKISEESGNLIDEKYQKAFDDRRRGTDSRRRELEAQQTTPAKIRAASADTSRTYLGPVSEKLLTFDVQGAYEAYLAEREKENNKDSPSFYIYTARLFHEVGLLFFFFWLVTIFFSLIFFGFPISKLFLKHNLLTFILILLYSFLMFNF